MALQQENDSSLLSDCIKEYIYVKLGPEEGQMGVIMLCPLLVGWSAVYFINGFLHSVCQLCPTTWYQVKLFTSWLGMALTLCCHLLKRL